MDRGDALAQRGAITGFSVKWRSLSNGIAAGKRTLSDEVVYPA
jgi:hypothetical protein